MSVKLKSVFKIFCVSVAFVLLCYIEGKFEIFSSKSAKPQMASQKIFFTDFEVFGTVQGVFFRKHTEEAANKFKIRGWCMNTKEGTVKGQIEGEEPAFSMMRTWLSLEGSPQSRIERAEFANFKEIPNYTFDKFEIRRVPKK